MAKVRVWKQGVLGPPILAGLGMVFLASACMPPALAQDVHSVSSGAVQSVRAGVTQNVRAGAIARRAGGESAGLGGFATSEVSGQVVSGRVKGYGVRQNSGGLPEYSYQGTASFGGGTDFPRADFVATMPRPSVIEYGAFSSGPGAAGFGVTLTTVQTRASAFGSAAHKAVHHTMKDPDAILNPFTHTIGPAVGSPLPGQGSLKATVLGAAKLP